MTVERRRAAKARGKVATPKNTKEQMSSYSLINIVRYVFHLAIANTTDLSSFMRRFFGEIKRTPDLKRSHTKCSDRYSLLFNAFFKESKKDTMKNSFNHIQVCLRQLKLNKKLATTSALFTRILYLFILILTLKFSKTPSKSISPNCTNCI